jgi:hypothetical protein
MCCEQLYTGIVKQTQNAKLSQLQSVELATCVLESIGREMGYSAESCICTMLGKDIYNHKRGLSLHGYILVVLIDCTKD